MPYTIVKRKTDDYVLKKEGKVISHHKTRAKAQASIRAIEASKHGAVMRNK